MPLILDSPVEDKKTINAYLIEQFIVDNKLGSLLIIYMEGYENDGQFVRVHTKTLNITGSEFLAVISAMPDASKNVYENLKDILYSLLQSRLGISGVVI